MWHKSRLDVPVKNQWALEPEGITAEPYIVANLYAFSISIGRDFNISRFDMHVHLFSPHVTSPPQQRSLATPAAVHQINPIRVAAITGRLTHTCRRKETLIHLVMQQNDWR